MALHNFKAGDYVLVNDTELSEHIKPHTKYLIESISNDGEFLRITADDGSKNGWKYTKFTLTTPPNEGSGWDMP